MDETNRTGRKSFFERMQHRLAPREVLVRFIASALTILLGFFLVEFAWNPQLFEMRPFHVAANLFFLTAVYSIIYYFFQRTRAAMIAFLAMCFALGAANYYLVKYKGQPVVPADLVAFPTAAEVGGGYSLIPDWHVAVCLVLFIAACVAIMMLPKHPFSENNAIISGFACLVSVLMLTSYLLLNDITEDFDCEPDSWSTTEYYADYGAALCFMKRVQDMYPNWPDGYQTEQAEQLLADYPNELALEGDNAAVKPTVLVVMNETFADLSKLSGVTGEDAQLTNYHRIARESLASGTAYASSFAGGTCNSEMEVLLGASMAFMSDDTYPYLFHDFADVESLVSTLEAQGYSTAAVHPAEGRNWTRDEVYADMGFDAFYDVEHFEDAVKLRGLVTDWETYNFMLDLVREEPGPTFVFGITMQNHSGYTIADLIDEPDCDVRINGKKYGEADEYAVLLQRSDDDLAYLIEQLEQLDEPVILLFFGDHQAYLSEVPKKDLYGWDPYEATLDQQQQRQEVPYLIWANYEIDAERAYDETTSLNYLGIQLLEAAGLPLSSYQAMLSELRETVPAINAKGYLTTDGTWHDHDEENGAVTEALRAYEMLQFANIFDEHIDKQAFVDGA